MLRRPEAAARRVDLLDDRVAQVLDGHHAGTKAERAILLARLLQHGEVVAAHLVANQHVVEPGAEAVEQLLQQIDRVAARIHHVPVGDREAGFGSHVEHARFVHPLDQRIVRLRGQIDQDAAVGLLDRRLDDRVERLVAVDQHRRCEAGIEAQQRAVRAVGVEAEERQILVDQVLRDEARHERLAHAAFLAADEVDVGHVGTFFAG